MNSLRLIAMSMTMVACCVQAQSTTRRKLPPPTPTPAAAIWESEPDTVLGISIGAPLAESGLPECAGASINVSGPLCVEKQPEPIGLQLPRQVSGDGIKYASTSVRVVDGTLVSLSLDFKQFKFNDFVDMFVGKYGPPTADYSETVENRSGASFASRHLSWNGKHMTIQLIERFGKVDDSHAIFSDNAAVLKAKAARQDKARAEGSKL